jgi:hypothetical protein
MANPKTIPQLPYVGSSGYTTNDIVPFVNYDVVSGTTKHTLLTDLKDYFSGNTVTITGGTNIEIIGSYPDFGIEFTGTTSTPFTGGTVSGATEFTNGLTANTLNVGGVNITGDTYVTGMTFNQSNYDLSIERNDGTIFTESLAILASDLTVTGGTYNPNTGEATFTNNTGGTFNVTGFLTGFTDTYVTGATYSDSNTFTFTNNTGGTFDVSFNVVTGLTATTISAVTYQNLPVSVLTEGTNISITNANGDHTISVTGLTNTQQVTPYNNSGSGSTINWDVSGTSTNYVATLTAATTLNLTNVRNGDFGTIIISQDGVGGRTLTLGTVNGSSTTHRVANGAGGSIVLTSNANAIDILTFTYNGSIMFWTVGNDYT